MDLALTTSLGTGATLTVTVQQTASHSRFKEQMGVFLRERAATESKITAKELYAERALGVVGPCFIPRAIGRQILSTPARRTLTPSA
jgi:hypothetical protein